MNVISNNLDLNTKFIYTIGSDNKKTEIIPPRKILLNTEKPKISYDLSKLPKIKVNYEDVDNQTPAVNLKPRVAKPLSNKNRPGGILTTDIHAF